MLSQSEESVDWYLVFTEAKIDHWIYKIINRSIGHVYAVQDLNDYQWLIVQPRVNYTEIKVRGKIQYPHIRLIAGPDAKIIKVEAKPQLESRGTLNWFNCVEQVKALVGIKSFWTLTPTQLYNGLIGGKYGRDSE